MKGARVQGFSKGVDSVLVLARPWVCYVARLFIFGYVLFSGNLGLAALFIQTWIQLIVKEFLEVFRLPYHPESTPDSFYAPDEASVQLKEGEENCWSSTHDFSTFIQREDKHQLILSESTDEESYQSFEEIWIEIYFPFLNYSQGSHK